MHKIHCPGCNRTIVLDDSELSLTIECVECGKRFSLKRKRPAPTPASACPYCASPVPAGAKKCPHCHEILDLALREARAAQEQAGREGPTVFMNAAASSSSGPAWWGTPIGCVVICSGIAAVLLMSCCFFSLLAGAIGGRDRAGPPAAAPDR